jgi:hypothetical protein
VGVERRETPWDHAPREPPDPPPAMPLVHKIVAGVFFGALYAGWMAYNDHLVPGVVGGILAAIVLVMVLSRMDERRRQRFSSHRRR